MPDRPRRGESGRPDEDGTDFDWLYGSERRRPDRSRERPQGRPQGDPEPTRIMPTMPRPEDPQRARTRPSEPAERPSARPPARPPQPAPRQPRQRRRPVAAIVTLVIAAWLAFLIAVPAWAWTQVTKVDAEPSDRRPAEQPGQTYLLVGSDSREGLTAAQRRRLGTGKAEGRRTDTILLLHTGDGPNLLLSIPRDSLVEVPGYGETKVNAAYAYGGADLLVRTLENETGIRIDNYVEIGFAGFVNVVNAVGGIEVCPEHRMVDKDANLRIGKGCQHVNGKTALGYARSRKTSALGDIDRARHQREVVSAVGQKAVSPWSVINPVRYFRLNSAAAESLAVGENTGPIDMVRFAWAMTRVSGESGLTCSVPIVDLAVHWDPERAPRLFKLIRQDRTEDVGNQLCRPSGLR